MKMYNEVEEAMNKIFDGIGGDKIFEQRCDMYDKFFEMKKRMALEALQMQKDFKLIMPLSTNADVRLRRAFDSITCEEWEWDEPEPDSDFEK